MAATFFFAATPHEFIHDELASHKDTIDHYHKHAGVSKVHIHCEFLRVSLSPTLPGHLPIFLIQSTFQYLFFVSPAISVSLSPVSHHFLRGPPHAC